MNNEYGGLITDIDEIVDIITENPEKMKELNLLQLAYVIGDVEKIIGDDYDKDFLLKEGITEKQAIYRGYLVYKIIILEAFEENPDITEYIDYLSNKDYVNTLKQAINSLPDDYKYENYGELGQCIYSIYNNRYRKNPSIGVKNTSDILSRFSIDDEEEKVEIDGYFELLELALTKDGESLKRVNEFKIDNISYLKLAKKAVSNCEHALGHVDTNRIDKETYKLFAGIAVSQNGFALTYVDGSKMSNEEYINIVYASIKQEGDPLEFVDTKRIDNKTYADIVLHALLQDGWALYHIEKSKIPDNVFREILKKVVRKNPSVMYNFKSSNTEQIDNETYIELAKISVSLESKTLKYIDMYRMNHETSMEIIAIALNNNPNIIYSDWFKFDLKEVIYYLVQKSKQEEIEDDKKNNL